MNAHEHKNAPRRGASRIGIILALAVAAAIGAAVFFVLRMDTTGRGGNRLGDEFQYPSAGRTIDPSLYRYAQVKEFPTGFLRVAALAVGPDDAVYVAGDASIRVFRDGRRTREIPDADGVRCLAAGPNGTIYAGRQGRVAVYPPGAEKPVLWPSLTGPAIITAIAADENNVFVADAGNHVVLRYDTGGKLRNRIGPKDAAGKRKPFVNPSPYFDLAVGADGLLRVAHTGRRLVEAYTFAGDREFAWGKSCAGIEGFMDCCNPVHLAVLPDGRIVTSEKGGAPAVKVFLPDGPDDPDGKLEGVVLGGEQIRPKGAGPEVAGDSKGRIYVLDAADRVVRIFARKESE